MKDLPTNASVMPFKGWALLVLGGAMLVFGWALPSRFKSIPQGVVSEAGQAGDGLGSMARDRLLDGNLGSASLLGQTALNLGDKSASVTLAQIEIERERNPQLGRWGGWDPFLDAALRDVPLDSYADEPGLMGVLIARPSRAAVSALLSNSRNPLLLDLLATGSLRSYQRLFPVDSSSGRPLEATLLGLGLLVQGERLGEGFKSELRELIWEAKASGAVGQLEDVYLDTLSLMRLFNWGQFEALASQLDSVESLKRLRYLLHRRAGDQGLSYAMTLASPQPRQLFDYLETYGDDGYEALRVALSFGLEGFRMTLREQLPIEIVDSGSADGVFGSVQAAFAPFSLKNPQLSLLLKYSAFFLGSFLALWGSSLFGRFYKESVSPALAYTQRLFGATAAVVVLGVLSEPYLARASASDGYTFRFVMPVLAQVDGELQIVETTPTTSMEPATLLSIAFFFLLQILVFLICMLKVREIDKRSVDELVKLKLMENEDNLFDSGLYVGIAGTCISLVMQVIGVVEANLLAAYSSNLFGILCVAIVKIRLVRPYKTRLIIEGQDRIVALSGKVS